MENPIQEIKEKLDIVEIIRGRVHLMPAGKNFKALCPFHKERTPSFIVSPERQTWHCFGSCNTGGDVFSFLMKYENVEFYEALKILAEKAGIELRKISPSSQKEFGVLYDINLAAKDFFAHQLQSSQEALDYLSLRNIKKETVDEFEIGFAPESFDSLAIHLANLGYEMADTQRAGLIFKNDRGIYTDRFRGRIIFPLYNNFGKVVGFSGRILPRLENDNTGKYINTSETTIFNKSKILYGFHKSKPFIKKENNCLLIEGQMDFLALWQEDVKNIVAVSGTALTPSHLQTVKRVSDDLIVSFDNDEAGAKATERSIDLAHELDFNVRVFVVPQAKDASEFISRNPGKIKGLIGSENISALQFYLTNIIKDISHPSKAEVRKLLEKTLVLYSPIEQSRWIKEISEKTKMSESVLLEELLMIKKKQGKYSQNAANFPAVQEAENLCRLDNLVLEILVLIFIDKKNLGLVKDYRSYFPDDYLPIIDWLDGKISSQNQPSDLINLLEMKAALKYQGTSQEKISLEISFLLKELKREFFKEKREKILRLIREKEKIGDTETVTKLLREFDEVAKLVDN